MSYPKDLTDYTDADLKREIRRRKQQRDKGLCDYCGRARETVCCKFPARHYSARRKPRAA